MAEISFQLPPEAIIFNTGTRWIWNALKLSVQTGMDERVTTWWELLVFFLVKGWSFLVNTRGRIVTCVALTFRYYLWVILFLALFCPFNLSSIEVKEVQLGHQHFKTSRGSMTLPRNFHIFAIWVSRTIAWRYTSENGRRPVNLWLH